MKINSNEQIVLVDVDDTLVTFNFKKKEKGILTVDFKGLKFKIKPLEKHIELLKQLKYRGFYIRVHSQGGKDWARLIVEKLKLNKFVDSVESKPKWYIDDLSADKWMARIYKYDEAKPK